MSNSVIILFKLKKKLSLVQKPSLVSSFFADPFWIIHTYLSHSEALQSLHASVPSQLPRE